MDLKVFNPNYRFIRQAWIWSRCASTVAKSEETEDQLNATAFHTYVYLVKAGKPVGPREVMRGADLTSPSVAYRNLQKLMDLGLVLKDEYGNYVVKEKVVSKDTCGWEKLSFPALSFSGLFS